MTTYRISKSIEEKDEVNKDAVKLEAWSKMEDGEMQQRVEYVTITIYELKRQKGHTYLDDGKFKKEQTGYARIPVSALRFIIGGSCD